MQVAGARQPLGVVAVLAPLQGLSGLSALAGEGLERVAKVLVEFCSDLLVAQELPAGGISLRLVLVIGGRGVGGAKPPRRC